MARATHQKSAYVLALALAGCGRVGFDDVAASAVDARSCTFGPWSAPVKLDDLSTTTPDFGGHIIGSGLAHYGRSEISGNGEFYVSRRTDRQAMFGAAIPIPELGSSSDEFDVFVTDDELEVYFTSDRDAGYCIYHAKRDGIGDAFANIRRLDALCPSGPAAGAFVTPDGLVLHYVRMDGQNYEGTLMMSTRASKTVDFDAGAPIPELVGGGFDKGYPALAADRLELFFDGGLTHHLYHATRATTADPWASIEMIPNVNSSAYDEDPSVTTDGLELYFGSQRGGGNGDDIYHSTRSCN